MSNAFKSLGKKTTSFEGLETFARPMNVKQVTCYSDEVTAVCPVTGQPDWYGVEIYYEPDKVCVESKSLKLFLQSFRNVGHFCENLSQVIADEIWEALQPHYTRVVINQKPRGGIQIASVAEKGEKII